MKIEAGKFYVTEDGEKVGPMMYWSDGVGYAWIERDNTKKGCWRDDGTAGRGSDLIAEYVEPAPSNIAEKAAAIVTGARRADYGTPENNFAAIARLWTAHLHNRGQSGVMITATDVAAMMRLMKEARLAENPHHRDSLVDVIGYAICQSELPK